MKPYFQRDGITIYNGDCRDILPQLTEQVHCCVTSPPYWGLRDYGHGNQIGLESTPQAYVETMTAVFEAARAALRDDGTCWLNLGDSYASSGGERTYGSSDNGTGRGPGTRRNDIPASGLKPKDLVGIPWRVAFALQSAGWWLRQDIIWCLSGGAKVYARTQKGDMPMMVKDLVRLDPSTVKLWNGQKWTQCLGWNESPRPDEPLEIELRSGEKIGCTPGHVFPTQRGNVRADKLQLGDVIDSTTLPDPGEYFAPAAIDSDVAWLIGLFLAEGNFDRDGRLVFSGHAEENTPRSGRMIGIARKYGGTVNPFESGNSGTVTIICPPLAAIMRQYIHGDNAKNKGLKVRAWKHTSKWLRCLLDGYLEGDGHHDEPNNRWRLGFTRNDRLADDIRTLSARIGATLTLKTSHSDAWGAQWPTYRGEIRFERSGHRNEKPKAEVVAIGRSRARRFYDIGVADDPHLFALASGVLTHNSKPAPMPESVRDRCTKAHEYIFLLAKAAKYYYDAEAIGEEASVGCKDTDFMPTSKKDKAAHANSALQSAATGASMNGRSGRIIDTRNKRSVWTVNTKPYKGAHFAVFPPALIEPCILAGCPEGGVVLDPFNGSGTTGEVCRRLGRRYVGIELNEEYCELAAKRFEQKTLF